MNKKVRVYEEPREFNFDELLSKYNISPAMAQELAPCERVALYRYLQRIDKVDNLRDKVYN